MLEAELKQLIVDPGGIRPGVARREAFKDSPPSADMTYLKPWAESVVSFAMTVGTDWIEDYFGKLYKWIGDHSMVKNGGSSCDQNVD